MERIGVAFTGGGMSPPKLCSAYSLPRSWGTNRRGLQRATAATSFHPHGLRPGDFADTVGHSISAVYVRSAPTIAMAAACVDHLLTRQVYPRPGQQPQGAGGAGARPGVCRANPRGSGTPLTWCAGCCGTEIWWTTREKSPTSSPSTCISYCDRYAIYLAAVFPKMLEIAGEISRDPAHLVYARTRPYRSSSRCRRSRAGRRRSILRGSGDAAIRVL